MECPFCNIVCIHFYDEAPSLFGRMVDVDGVISQAGREILHSKVVMYQNGDLTMYTHFRLTYPMGRVQEMLYGEEL